MQVSLRSSKIRTELGRPWSGDGKNKAPGKNMAVRITLHPGRRAEGGRTLLQKTKAVFMLICFRIFSSRSSVGRDSSVGIATRYEVDGPEIECRWGRDFPHLSRQAMGPNELSVQWVPGLFPGVKRHGRGVEHPPPFRAEVKERMEYFPSGLSWPLLGWPLS